MELVGTSSLKQEWLKFLESENADLSCIAKIDFSTATPVIFDQQGRKFSIDFIKDLKNYNKKKGGLNTELLSKAMGSGKKGLKILDLSAGLGIDAVFLSQLGYLVTAVERNPLIFLALKAAYENLIEPQRSRLNFIYSTAQTFLLNTKVNFDIIYFDPMFGEKKKKSALPKQEMVLFRELVGWDEDALEVINTAIASGKSLRLVVKRPLSGAPLRPNPQASLKGKLVRYDIYKTCEPV